MHDVRVSPGIAWAVRSAGILLLNTATGAAVELAYPDAAVWDMMSRGESPDRIAAQLGPIAQLDRAAARQLVEDRVQAWIVAGLVTTGAIGG